MRYALALLLILALLPACITQSDDQKADSTTALAGDDTAKGTLGPGAVVLNVQNGRSFGFASRDPSSSDGETALLVKLAEALAGVADGGRGGVTIRKVNAPIISKDGSVMLGPNDAPIMVDAWEVGSGGGDFMPVFGGTVNKNATATNGGSAEGSAAASTGRAGTGGDGGTPSGGPKSGEVPIAIDVAPPKTPEQIAAEAAAAAAKKAAEDAATPPPPPPDET